MTIGEALKSLRLNAGLTQTEMAGDIISESFYSKVERGVSEIDASTLVGLLNSHHFDVVTFFSHISNQEMGDKEFSLTARIIFAQNKKDLKELDKIKKEIENSDKKRLSPTIQYRLELAYAWVERSNDNVSPDLKKRVNNILKNENWDRISYHYLSQAVILLDIDKANYWVNSAFQAFKKHPSYDTFTLQFMGMIAINFLNCCYHKNGKQYSKTAINFLRSLPLDEVLGLPNVLATYYEALFSGDHELLSSSIAVLKKSGYLSLVEDTLNE